MLDLTEQGAEPNFGNFRGIQTLNRKWKEIYLAAGFRLSYRDSVSDGPDWDTCIPSLAIRCKTFLRKHLKTVRTN